MSNKFKVGDLIVVVRNFSDYPSKSYINREFVISNIDRNVAFPPRGSNEYGAYLADIELKSIIDSPLYKALT